MNFYLKWPLQVLLFSPMTALTQVRAQWAAGRWLPWTSLMWSPARVTCWVTCWTWTWALQSMCPRSPPCRWVRWTFWAEAWTVWWAWILTHTQWFGCEVEALDKHGCRPSQLSMLPCFRAVGPLILSSGSAWKGQQVDNSRWQHKIFTVVIKQIYNLTYTQHF